MSVTSFKRNTAPVRLHFVRQHFVRQHPVQHAGARPGWPALALLPAWLSLAVLLGACAFGGANAPVEAPPADETQQQQPRTAQRQRAMQRPPINTSRNLYEGSLWQGAASWGNLLRDHRARYRGDLLTVADLQKIVKVPEVKPEQAPQQQQEQEQQQRQEQEAIDPVLAFLRAQEEHRAAVEREQNEILRSIDSVEVQVVRVLPNGNMLVRGVHPPIFRDRNRIKYVVTLEGLARPSDVDENNNITATRISKAEVKIRRFVRRETPPLGDLARAGGKPKQGELLDRLTNFITSPGTGNRSTQASPR